MWRVGLIRWGALAAILGGVLWILLYTGHTFTHGSTQSPRNATILGLESLDFYRLLALPSLLFIIGLFGTRATRASTSRRLGRVAFLVALLGLVMIGFGVILETWILDVDKDFEHPLVQGGWILFLFGLCPVVPVGMILYGIRARDMERRLRILTVSIGVLAPLQWFEMFLSSVSTGSVVWDLAYVVLRGLFGLGWIVLGYVLWSIEPEEQLAARRQATVAS